MQQAMRMHSMDAASCDGPEDDEDDGHGPPVDMSAAPPGASPNDAGGRPPHGGTIHEVGMRHALMTELVFNAGRAPRAHGGRSRAHSPRAKSAAGSRHFRRVRRAEREARERAPQSADDGALELRAVDKRNPARQCSIH
jgi:hypothetical protein